MSSKINHNADKHPKQDFQVERIAFFSDAVFAFAITLLVIDLKIPHVTHESTYDEIWKEVLDLKYMFGAVLFSFAMIMIYWMRHHLLFKHIHNYNSQILRMNMVVMLPIIFFPFTTAFFYETANMDNNEVLVIPLRLFLINNIVAGATSYYFYWMVMKRFPEMSYPMEKKDKQEFEIKLLFTNGSFLLILILTFFVPLKYSLLGVLPTLMNFRTNFSKKDPLKKNA